MIPKKLHYCWLSGESMPSDLEKCLQTWRTILPDYEIVLWDKRRFDVNSVPFVAEACEARKWAFASDYIRLYALYTEGGIYLDTDVVVKKSLDNFLQYGFFTAVEYHQEIAEQQAARDLLNFDGTIKEPQKNRPFTHGIGIQAAIMGSDPKHPFLKDCLDWYQTKHFRLADGTLFTDPVSPAIYADIALSYGFRYKDEMQELRENMMIFPSKVFAGNITAVTAESYAVHCVKGSWRTPKEKIYKHIKDNLLLRKLLGKNPMPTIDDVIAFPVR